MEDFLDAEPLDFLALAFFAEEDFPFPPFLDFTPDDGPKVEGG